MKDIAELFQHLGEPMHLIYFLIGVVVFGFAGGVANLLYTRFMTRYFPRVTTSLKSSTRK